MHIDRRLVGFGLFLITVGGTMVAVRQGLLTDAGGRHAWSLWPMILIGAGLSIVLAGRPRVAIGGLVLALTFGANVGGVAATGAVPGVGPCGRDQKPGVSFPTSGEGLGTAARVTIALDCGDLTTVSAGWAALCRPVGVALRVKLESVAASNDFAAHGLVETDGTWQTPGYATATTRLELRADVNAGSLSLDPVRTCGN